MPARSKEARGHKDRKADKAAPAHACKAAGPKDSKEKREKKEKKEKKELENSRPSSLRRRAEDMQEKEAAVVRKRKKKNEAAAASIDKEKSKKRTSDVSNRIVGEQPPPEGMQAEAKHGARKKGREEPREKPSKAAKTNGGEGVKRSLAKDFSEVSSDDEAPGLALQLSTTRTPNYEPVLLMQPELSSHELIKIFLIPSYT